MTDPRIRIRTGGVLAYMLKMQREFQSTLYGQDPATFSDERKMEFLRMNMLAMEDELHEALAETGWKPWASSNHINREAFVGELVDAWHFFMNLLNLVDVSAEELMTLYAAKQAINRKRQQDGYDGVSGKCPGCHRAYDDSAVKCSPTHQGPDGAGMGWCEVYGTIDTPVVQA